ncbi:MAG: tetratricopeptide repeat protein [Chloroflexi bacterium]|nr:tetratricopeptide repeat protein [Chloroflexota bacterium]
MSFFGPFQVTLNQQPLSGWRYDKVRALLVYLACEQSRAHSRDELAAMLWPDSANAAARKSLRQALTILRAVIDDETAVPPHLLASRETLQFNPASSHTLDVTRFATLVRQVQSHAHNDMAACDACLTALAQATALYHGDLLAGFSLPESVPFEEWLISTRERLRLQTIEALGQLAAAYAHRNSHDLAVQATRQQLALDPWNETAVRLLMGTLAQRGQRAAALAEYERCKRILADELGITPSAETIALYREIRGEEGAAAWQPLEQAGLSPAVVPTPLSPLIGREQETTAVITFLRQDSVRLLTLMGPPGVGKTRLALHVAQALQADFQGSVYYVALAGIADPTLVTVAIARTMGVPGDQAKASPLLQLTRELQNKRALLVLDNFEQLLASAAAVLDLLHACPQLKILVTSRAPLNLRGEQRYLLPTLPDDPAIRLFVARTQAIVPDFRLTPENETAVAAICRQVDGLPLAIELAAARVRLLPPQRLLQQLSSASGKALSLLKGGGRSSTDHHQTLHQAIEWSYDLLDEAQRRLFARLGVFASGFTLEAAEAVCQIGPGAPDLAESIENLLDNSLLRRSETAVHGYRFLMLQTIRHYALERLADNGEAPLMASRHADYFLGLAKIAAAELAGHNQAIWLERLEGEQNNCRAALEWSIEHSPEQGLELAAALFPFWHTRSYLREGRLWLDRALAQDGPETAMRARALAAAGLLAQRMGDYAQAESQTRTAVALSQQLGDSVTTAYALNNLGIVLMSQGNNSAALQLAEESRAFCQAAGDEMGVSRALMIIGQVALHEDRLATAEEALAASLAFWRRQGDRKNAILCLLNLGRVHMMRGAYAAAAQVIREGVALSRAVGDRHFEMVGLWTVGEIALLLGDTPAAVAQYEVCLAQAREIGDQYFEALTLSKLGLLQLEVGRSFLAGRGSEADAEATLPPDWAAAERSLQVSLELARQIGARWGVADALGNLGLAALRQQNPDQAGELLRQSLQLFYEQGDRANTVLVLERLAAVAAAQTRPEPAAQLLGAANAWRIALENPLPPNEKADYQQLMTAIRRQLGERPFALAFATGQAMSLEQALSTAAGLPGKSAYPSE